MVVSVDVGARYELKLPWTSPPLTMNQRLHYRVKAKLTKEIRDAAFLLAKHHKVPKHCGRIRVTLVYHPTDRRRRDAINLAPTLKAIEDGLVDAQVVPDDTPTYIDPVMPIIADPVKGGRLLAVIDVLS